MSLHVDTVSATLAAKAPFTLLRGGTVIDGTGAPRIQADVLIHEGRIAAVGQDLPLPASADVTPIDCRGRVVAPGFIDVHTHDDALLLQDRTMAPKLSQGVTSVVAGNCGISLVPLVTDAPAPPLNLLGEQSFRHASVAAYRQAFEARPPGVNAALLVGHTTLRFATMDRTDRAAEPAEIACMAELLDACLGEGAIGLSSGLFYGPASAAPASEVTALARVVARHGGVYTTHLRTEMEAILDALDEAADCARDAGVPLVISHHKCAGPANWGRSPQTLAHIESLAQRQRVALDAYPYTAGSTVLREDLVDGVIDVRVTWSTPHPEAAGRMLADLAAEWGISQKEACRRLQPGGACYFQMREDDVARIVSHPMTMIGSDGLPHDQHPHPRLWGAFPRVLGHYCREQGLFTLEQAVHKMTGLSARNFRLVDRGEIRPGAWADITVFDPERIIDRATFDSPLERAAGIESVWVNGQLSWTQGGAGPALGAGRLLSLRAS